MRRLPAGTTFSQFYLSATIIVQYERRTSCREMKGGARRSAEYRFSFSRKEKKRLQKTSSSARRRNKPFRREAARLRRQAVGASGAAGASSAASSFSARAMEMTFTPSPSRMRRTPCAARE